MTEELALIVQELKNEIAKWQSPWVLIRDAAIYCGGVSQNTIRKMADKGLIERRFMPGTNLPVFSKADLDEAIRSGWVPKNRRGRKPEQRQAA